MVSASETDIPASWYVPACTMTESPSSAAVTAAAIVGASPEPSSYTCHTWFLSAPETTIDTCCDPP